MRRLVVLYMGCDRLTCECLCPPKGEPLFCTAKAAIHVRVVVGCRIGTRITPDCACHNLQEAKLRNQGRKRGERFSALPLAKQSPDHPVLHGVSQ